MKKDYFHHKAEEYDESVERVTNVNNIVSAIEQQVTLNADMHVLDFGSGTGLLLERIAPLVERMTAVDISPSMNAQLERKRDHLACEIDILELDLAHELIDLCVDGIVSSMTLHHIEDIPALLSTLHGLLKPKGFIALADLEEEDGTFHEENTGVFHMGFDPGWIKEITMNAGFEHIRTSTASVVKKSSREYPVFLLTAIAP